MDFRAREPHIMHVEVRYDQIQRDLHDPALVHAEQGHWTGPAQLQPRFTPEEFGRQWQHPLQLV
jgi:hypothetical protein